jgi:DNA polymerase III subunit delta
MPIYLLAGDEDFELSRRVEKLKAEIVDPAWTTFNFVRLTSPDLSAVIDAAASLPFGPGNRMVLMDRCDLFTKKKGKSADSEKSSEKLMKQLLDDLDKALSSVSQQTFLVFACPYNFDPALRTSKVVGKYARMETFEKPRYFAGSPSVQLMTWCRKEAHHYDATIDDEAITYLLDSTEANLRQVAAEIEKAVIYIHPEKRITLKVVSTLSSHYSHVFALLDHWAAGRREETLQTLEELLSRQSAMPILATLHTTLSKWAQFKALEQKFHAALPGGRGIQRRELNINELAEKIAGELKTQSKFVIMDLRRIRPLSADWIMSKRTELTDLDLLIKTGQMPDQHALTVFLSH